MKNNCNVAKDLMPLVIDGVASEESQQYVTEHIAECTDCAVTYGSMRVELPLAKVNAEKERAEMEKAAKELKRRRRLRRIVSVLLSLALIAGAVFLWQEIDYQLTEKRSQMMPLDEYQVSLTQTKDGSGIILVNLKDDERRSAGVDIEYNYNFLNSDGLNTLEISVLTTVLPQYLKGDEANVSKMLRTVFMGTVIDGEWSNKQPWNHSHIEEDPFKDQEYTFWDEIAVVCGDERKVIYTRGDKIPLCSEELEAYYEAYHDNQPVGKTMPEWRADLVKLLDAVPELACESAEDYYKLYYVCENGDLKLDALYYDVSSGDSQNTRVQTDVFSFLGGNPTFDLVIDTVTINDGTAVCIQYHAVYQGANDSDKLSGVYSWVGRIEDGEFVAMSDDVRGEDGSWAILPIVRIELHAGDDYVVLWEEGDVLQTPAEAKAKREQEVEKYMNK